jgi:hypothetical protein
MLAHMGTKRPPYSWLTHIETPKQLLDVVASGEYSPLELLLESATTPQAVKDLAKQCCQPDPIMRPTFGQISELIIAAIPEGAELRPAARIRNKHPLGGCASGPHCRGSALGVDPPGGLGPGDVPFFRTGGTLRHRYVVRPSVLVLTEGSGAVL